MTDETRQSPAETVSHAPVAWIAFAGNGNVQFWTADQDRAAAEKESGRDLRTFTLAELVALVAQLGAHERLQARIVEALGIEIWQGDLADAVAAALGKQLNTLQRPEGNR